MAVAPHTGHMGEKSKQKEKNREDDEVARAFQQTETPIRPRAVHSGHGPLLGARHFSEGWSSPVDDTEEETSRTERHGPEHPLPPKVHRNVRSPTRSWEATMPARVSSLSPVLRDSAKPSSATFGGRRSSSEMAHEQGDQGTRIGQSSRRSPRLAAKMGRKRPPQDHLVDNDDDTTTFHGFRPIFSTTNPTCSSSKPID